MIKYILLIIYCISVAYVLGRDFWLWLKRQECKNCKEPNPVCVFCDVKEKD